MWEELPFLGEKLNFLSLCLPRQKTVVKHLSVNCFTTVTQSVSVQSFPIIYIFFLFSKLKVFYTVLIPSCFNVFLYES